jgi:hypothetical protein
LRSARRTRIVRDGPRTQPREKAVKALSGREVRITTANVVLLKGERATWGEAVRRDPWSVAGIDRPKL